MRKEFHIKIEIKKGLGETAHTQDEYGPLSNY